MKRPHTPEPTLPLLIRPNEASRPPYFQTNNYITKPPLQIPTPVYNPTMPRCLSKDGTITCSLAVSTRPTYLPYHTMPPISPPPLNRSIPYPSIYPYPWNYLEYQPIYSFSRNQPIPQQLPTDLPYSRSTLSDGSIYAFVVQPNTTLVAIAYQTSILVFIISPLYITNLYTQQQQTFAHTRTNSLDGCQFAREAN